MAIDINADDIEYIMKYGFRKADRLKLEEAADRLLKAAENFGKQRAGVGVGTQDVGETMNAVYDAALLYGSVRLYLATRGVHPSELSEEQQASYQER